MSIELPDARQLSDEALQVLRLRALHGIELGFSEVELADLLGVCNETISRWWTAYAAEGLDSLPGGRTGRPLGSGRFLSDQQAERIQELIDNNSPEQVGDRSRPVDASRCSRPDPQGVRHRPGGANGRAVPAPLGLHLQEASAAFAQAGTRRGPAVAGGDVPGHRSPGGKGECGDPLDRRGRCRCGSPSRLRLRPRRRACHHGGARAAHPGEPDHARSATRERCGS